MSLEEKTAFITGTNRGLGKAFVEAFAEAHYNVVAHTRRKTADFLSWCNDVSLRYGVQVIPICFDVREEEAVKDAIRNLLVVKKVRIDVLLNNAGIMHENLLCMTSMAHAREQFNVNFFAPFLLMQLISRSMMRHRGGVIINMSSRSAFDGVMGGAVYGATKAALAAMSKSLAKELGRYNIRVNCIAPGVIDTDLTSGLSENAKNAQRALTYMGRLGCPDDVAGVALFLASDAAKYITGQVFRVDGGLN